MTQQTMVTKAIKFETSEINEDGSFFAKANTYNIKDSQDEICTVETFKNSVEQFNNGQLQVKLCDAHNYDSVQIGRIDALENRADGLYVRGQLVTAAGTKAAEYYHAIKIGSPIELSIGAFPIRTHKNAQGVTINDEMSLYEISLCNWGASQGTQFINIKSATCGKELNIMTLEELQALVETQAETINTIATAVTKLQTPAPKAPESKDEHKQAIIKSLQIAAGVQKANDPMIIDFNDGMHQEHVFADIIKQAKEQSVLFGFFNNVTVGASSMKLPQLQGGIALSEIDEAMIVAGLQETENNLAMQWIQSESVQLFGGTSVTYTALQDPQGFDILGLIYAAFAESIATKADLLVLKGKGKANSGKAFDGITNLLDVEKDYTKRTAGKFYKWAVPKPENYIDFLEDLGLETPTAKIANDSTLIMNRRTLSAIKRGLRSQATGELISDLISVQGGVVYLDSHPVLVCDIIDDMPKAGETKLPILFAQSDAFITANVVGNETTFQTRNVKPLILNIDMYLQMLGQAYNTQHLIAVEMTQAQ